MLVLTRRRNENVHIRIGDTTVIVKTLFCDQGRCRLGFDAPANAIIVREEIANGSTIDPSPPTRRGRVAGKVTTRIASEAAISPVARVAEADDGVSTDNPGTREATVTDGR